MSNDYAVHSDFLIHWTGKDIDQVHEPNWWEGNRPGRNDRVLTDLYLKRLRDILTYGLWMTEEGERLCRVGSTEIAIPASPQCCFTELKLSESRQHAINYGRLGIGVKRPFLFERFGRPIAYFGFGERKQNDKFLEACAHDLEDKKLLNFFKPMNAAVDNLNYDLYSESEWRILYFDELLQQRKIIDPRNRANEMEHGYFNSLSPEDREKLKYLIPLDGWFTMIIYPSLPIKNAAQWNSDYDIETQVTRIKSDSNDHANRVEGLSKPSRGNWPIEVNLDACRNF